MVWSSQRGLQPEWRDLRLCWPPAASRYRAHFVSAHFTGCWKVGDRPRSNSPSAGSRARPLRRPPHRRRRSSAPIPPPKPSIPCYNQLRSVLPHRSWRWNAYPRRACVRGACLTSRGVAQPGRAPGSGPGGRRFKSSLPDQYFQLLLAAVQAPEPTIWFWPRCSSIPAQHKHCAAFWSGGARPSTKSTTLL